MGLDLVITGLIVITAIAALKTESIRSAIIFFGTLSLLASFLFMLYHAPDVALAEAIIGSGIVTLLFLIALRQYRVYRICFADERGFLDERGRINADRAIWQIEQEQITKSIEKFCLARELEPQLVVSGRPVAEEADNPNYDIVLSRGSGGRLEIHGNEENALLVEIVFFLQWNHSDLDIVVHELEEEP